MRSLLAGLLLCTACASAAAPPPEPDPEPARARAALATLHVENMTTQPLSILYRFANRSAPDVGVGTLEPGATAELAPVPAGEPLVLIARLGSGAELSTGPRTFAIDGSWVWRIPRDARFVRPPARQP
jgi:hypothetical protein